MASAFLREKLDAAALRVRMLTVLVTVAASTAVFASVAMTAAHGGPRAVGKVIAEADVIAVVEILSTDYRATAADGPMYAEARVFKVLKGDLSLRRKLRFAETAWWGPTYKKGERRIIFLGRQTPGDEYYKAKWHTIDTGLIDYFFAADSVGRISRTSVVDFLAKIQEASGTPPRIEFRVTQRSAGRRRLSIHVVNDDDQPFWVNPSRFAASFEAKRVRYSRAITWANYATNTWVKIEPTARIVGFMHVRDVEVQDEKELKVTLSHLGAYFPHRCWVGWRSVTVSLRE